MAEKRGGLAGRVGRRTVVEVSSDGGTTKQELPGIGSVSIAVGEAPSDTTPAFEGSFVTLGEAPVGDVNLQVISYLPNHPAWKLMDDAFSNGDNVHFTITTPERVIFGPSTGDIKASVAKTSGIVSFAGGTGNVSLTDGTVQRGMTLKIGTTHYTIASLDVSDSDSSVVEMKVVTAPPKFEPPAAAEASAVYSIVLPGLEWTFSAGVKQMGSLELGTDAPLGSQLVVTPSSRIGLPSFA